MASFAVYDADYLLHLLGIESGKHVVDDVLWLFETWVVAGDDYLIALLYSLLCHQWTLALCHGCHRHRKR